MAEALLANANAGGENVARGALLGALFGAAYGAEAIPAHLKRGLSRSSEIEQEIEAFVARCDSPVFFWPSMNCQQPGPSELSWHAACNTLAHLFVLQLVQQACDVSQYR